MKILAHRGISAHFLQNTIPAFEAALEAKVDGLEIDVHQVEDEFIIYHDFNFSRLGQDSSFIYSMKAKAVTEIKLEQGHRIPTLKQVLETVNGQCLLNLELKQVRQPKKLIPHLIDYVYQTSGHLILSSFNHALVMELQALIRDTRIKENVKFAGLIGHLPIDLASYAVNMQLDIAAIDADMVNADFVKDAHKYCIQVYAYTVNSPNKFQELLEMGVDGIFSNDPELLR